jgi:hypothetical protein
MHRVVLYFLMLYIILWRLPRFIPTPPLVRVRTTRMQSGDLLLYSGRSLDSALIRAWTNGSFTHVGLVWCDTDGCTYIWNSDKHSDVKCVLNGCARDGPQLQRLDEKIAQGSGCMYHVPWNDAQYRRPALTREYMLAECKGVTFRDSMFVMGVAALPDWCPSLAHGHANALLCTELVAKTIYDLTGYYAARRTQPYKFLALPLFRRDLLSLV